MILKIDTNLDNEKQILEKYGNKPLSKKEAERLLKDLEKGWMIQKDPDKLVKGYSFENFKKAIEFVNKIAEVTENINHHPNIYIHSYKKVKIEIWTHSIGGIHQVDFILARKIDKLRGPTPS